MAGSTGKILATDNWWGDRFGPNVDGSNPAGQTVQGDVTTTDWVGTPYNFVSSSKSINSSVFINNTVALYSSGSESAVEVNGCTQITNNSSYGARAFNNSVISATVTWWGSADGPDNGNNGSGDAVDGNVIYSPWAADTNCTTTGGQSNGAIAGKITDSNNTPIPGVTISTNSGPSTATGTDGSYTLSNLADGAYTLTPSKLNYTFSPVSLTVTIPPDKTGQNFIAVAKDELVCSVETALDLLGISSASDTVEAFDTPAELLTLYTRIRDEVFNPSSTGQQFVDLFYEHTTELSIILLNNPDLRSRTAQFLQNASEAFASLLPGATTTVPLTQNLYDEADALVRDLAAAGSPEFATEMLDVWAELALSEHVDENATDIWISMQSKSVYLPVVIK